MEILKPLKIVCIGEAMVEVALPKTGLDAAVGFAGDTLNTAIYLKRHLRPQDSVSFMTVLGSDSLSGQMIEFMQQEGLSTDHISRIDNRLPGLYTISNDKKGERSFNYWRENSAATRLFQTEGPASFAELSTFDAVYFSGITLAILDVPVREQFFTWLLRYKKQGNKTIVFDSNYRPVLWANAAQAQKNISRAWSLADVGLPSVDDEMALFGDHSGEEVIKRLRSWGLGYGVLKCGANGPVSINNPSLEINLSVVDDVVDSTAAGDSFNGAFLAGHLTKKPFAEAMADGHNCAAKVISQVGAIVPLTES